VGAGDGGQGEGVRREPYQGRPILRRTWVRPDQRPNAGEVIGHRSIPPGAATGARRGRRRLDRLARYFARVGVLLRMMATANLLEAQFLCFLRPEAQEARNILWTGDHQRPLVRVRPLSRGPLRLE